jgi:hypothetical protein
MAKSVTREQAERKKTQAAAFMGLQIANPTRKARKTTMAASEPSKAELQDQIDDAVKALNNAYPPEASREDLTAAVGEALLRGSGRERRGRGRGGIAARQCGERWRKETRQVTDRALRYRAPPPARRRAPHLRLLRCNPHD